MSNLEKIIFDKLKLLVSKDDTRADLTMDEYAKIFKDPDIFVKQITKEILLAIKKETTND